MIFYFVNLTTTPQGFSMNNRHPPQKKKIMGHRELRVIYFFSFAFCYLF